jgi:hypothetical protein
LLLFGVILCMKRLCTSKLQFWIFCLFLVPYDGFSQGNYFNYLDSTCEWRYFSSGWSFYVTEEYSTVYFDGDTSINGKAYYKQFRLKKVVDYPGTNTITNYYLYGPGFVREDSSKKFFYYSANNNTETEFFDSHGIVNAQIGDTMPYPGSSCTVNNIDTFYLGSRSLRHLDGVNFPPSGILEGVGRIGPVCGLGVEYNSILACFKKQTDEIQFGSFSCGIFPMRYGNYQFTGLNAEDYDSGIKMFPNPSANFIQLEWNAALGIKKIELTDVRGRIIQTLIPESTLLKKTIELKDVESGIYFVNFYSVKGIVSNRIIKD